MGAVGVLEEVGKEVELGGREGDFLAIAKELPRFEVEGEGAEGDGGVSFLLALATEDRFGAGKKFADAEGFGHVIVRPELEAHDDIGFLPLGREHDDGHGMAARSRRTWSTS